MKYQNVWEMVQRLLELGLIQENLSEEMMKNSDSKAQSILEQKMDLVDKEFVEIKHILQDIRL